MIKETVVTAKTVELAVNNACLELGVSADEVEYVVLEEAKKGILGIGACDAKVQVTIKRTPAVKAIEFLEGLIKNMNLNATVNLVSKDDEGATIAINGDSLGILIGRSGDAFATSVCLRARVA